MKSAVLVNGFWFVPKNLLFTSEIAEYCSFSKALPRDGNSYTGSAASQGTAVWHLPQP